MTSLPEPKIFVLCMCIAPTVTSISPMTSGHLPGPFILAQQLAAVKTAINKVSKMNDINKIQYYINAIRRNDEVGD